ncbi:MAG: SUF system Fe-S cluster assembly protein [Saprospiraceae bacterium]
MTAKATTAINSQTNMDTAAVKDQVIEQIKTVYDPEIPVDIYELGLIYDVDVQANGMVKVRMTLTTPMCPVADSLPMEVQEKIIMVPEVSDVDLQVVFDPPWNKEMMSEEARFSLDMF